VLHPGPFDRWDLEIRSGALASVRVRSVLEEHGAGRQLIRIKARPRVSVAALAVVSMLTALAALASIGHVAVAAIVGALGLVLFAHLFIACAAGKGAVRQAVDHIAHAESAWLAT